MEAVRLETNSIFWVIATGVFPQIRICISATVIFSMAEAWNMVEQPMYFLKQKTLIPLSMFIHEISGYSGTVLFPASVISMIPMLLAYVFFYDGLQSGITLGGIHE